MRIGRWYRKPLRGGGFTYRMPLKMGSYADSGRPKVKYRQIKMVSACSGAAWLKWAKGAELMPDGWSPPGVDAG